MYTMIWSLKVEKILLTLFGHFEEVIKTLFCCPVSIAVFSSFISNGNFICHTKATYLLALPKR